MPMKKGATGSESSRLLTEISKQVMQNSEELLARLNERRYASRRITARALASVRNGICSLVTRMSDDDVILRAVARRSYAHDNNFAKLVLVQASEGPREVRLHVWGPAAGFERRGNWETNIHEHSADFVSLVVVGGLTERIYEMAEQGEGRSGTLYRAFHCGSRSEETAYRMSPGRYGRLRVSREYVRIVGGWNGLRYDVLHRVRPIDGDTVTLFCQGPRRQVGTSVYCSPKKAWPEVVRSPTYTEDQVRKFLLTIRDLCERDADY